MGAIQPWHLIFALAIVLIVLGPGKLPDVGKAFGQGLREFRKATGDVTGIMTGEPVTPAQAPAAFTQPVDIGRIPAPTVAAPYRGSAEVARSEVDRDAA